MHYKKYSDIVTLRESKAAYNIQNEESGEWRFFIANEQFNGILEKIIKSVFNNNADNHKSFWISGTYGTGKSHAAAVIKHLLCDPMDDIVEFIQEEYKEHRYEQLRDNILNLRNQKRLFPVMLYGLESIVNKEDLSLQLQLAITRALKNEGISTAVKTDFENYIEHIQNKPDFWEIIIKNNPKLPQSAEKLIRNLRNGDKATLSDVRDALQEDQLHLRLTNADLTQWIFEVQDELVNGGVYDGLLIIWDEFTDVMRSAAGVSLLLDLQKIAEQTMNSKNNSYLMLISHPSALDNIKDKDREHTTGRYHYMYYNMEPVSAFKIMSRKLKLANDEDAARVYNSLADAFYDEHDDLLDIYASTSTNAEETRKDIRNLFPLHPSTANLATYYAREAGASSRSVFEFLGQNEEITDFLENEEYFENNDTITADYLWDYVLDEFNTKVVRFGAVTERFNSYKKNIENEGDNHFAVFKGILLLNALNNIANHETVTPSEENIKNLFAGTRIESEIDFILNYFNDNSIIQRAPGGLFSIQFSALPAKEIEDTTIELANTQFKNTWQIVNFGETVSVEAKKLLANVSRESDFKLYGEDVNEYTLLNKIENGYKSTKSYEIFIAFLFARNNNELNTLKEIAEKAAKEERFHNVTFIVFENVFTDNNYERFIEYQANAMCAQKHGIPEQYKVHNKFAIDMLKEWMSDIRKGNFTYYLRNKTDVFPVSRITTAINACVSPIIFSKGIETLDIIKTKSPKTFWQKKSVKATVESVLSFNTKDDISQRNSGQSQHVPYLLQDSVDDNLKWLPDIDKEHPLYLVCSFIDNKLKNADKNNVFNLGDKLIDLSRPPFGLYQSYAGMSMVAFAMRNYIKQIFDTNGKPREKQHIVEDVVEMFKAWESGKSSNKLNFMFETKESRDLYSKFVKHFQLQSLKDYRDISSLTDARWAILHAYSKIKGYPLWVLKYAEKDIPEGLKKLIDNILEVCGESGIRNPHLMSETLNSIEKYHIELANLLIKDDNFSMGYIKFLMENPVVKLQEKEVPDAINYIRTHLEKEVGLWTEEEVNDVLKDWRIEEAERLRKEKEEIENRKKAELEKGKYAAEDKPQYEAATVPLEQRISIKEKINKITDLNIARKILEEICEKGNSNIIDIIERYV